MLYFLSKFIPIRMVTHYTEGETGLKHKDVWWQWRDHIFFHRTVVIH